MIQTIEKRSEKNNFGNAHRWSYNEKIIKTEPVQEILRRQVWEADLGEGIGSEQGSKRPVLIIQNDKGNKYSPTVTIIPLTSKTKNNLPTHVYIAEKFLTEKSTVIIEQIRTIDKSRLIKILGEISEVTMNLIEVAVDIQVKEFDYQKAYELYEQIQNVRGLITKCGSMPELLKTYNYFTEEFKNYCNRYMKNHFVVIQEIKYNYYSQNTNIRMVN